MSRVFGVDSSRITDETSNKNLPEWDSLAHMTLILELEAAYGVSFSAADALEMTNVKIIKEKLGDYQLQ